MRLDLSQHLKVLMVGADLIENGRLLHKLWAATEKAWSFVMRGLTQNTRVKQSDLQLWWVRVSFTRKYNGFGQAGQK